MRKTEKEKRTERIIFFGTHPLTLILGMLAIANLVGSCT